MGDDAWDDWEEGLASWELDDWEEEAFDEDVYDVSLLDDVEEPFDVGLAGGPGQETPVAPADGMPVAAAYATTRTPQGESPMTWSAWEVGTVFALGGWLADRHAENTARQVASVLEQRGLGRNDFMPLGAAHPPPASGYVYEDVKASLGVGDRLDALGLYAEMLSADVKRQDLLLRFDQAPGVEGSWVLYVSVVPTSSGPQMWAVAEENRGGFNALRLIPVFERSKTVGAGVFATDHPDEVAEAVVWACHRHGLRPDELVVTERNLKVAPPH